MTNIPDIQRIVFPKPLKPIADVLLETFPWIDRTTKEPSTPEPSTPDVRVWPGPGLGFSITMTRTYWISAELLENQIWVRLHGVYVEEKGAEGVCAPGDKTDAVGLISNLLPKWKEHYSFQDPVFHLFGPRDQGVAIAYIPSPILSGSLYLYRATHILMSPSGRMFMGRDGLQPTSWIRSADYPTLLEDMKADEGTVEIPYFVGNLSPGIPRTIEEVLEGVKG